MPAPDPPLTASPSRAASSRRPPVPQVPGGAVGAAFARLFSALARNMAVQDFAVLGFHSFMWLRITFAPDGADAEIARKGAFVLLSVTVCAILIGRGEIIPRGFARTALYRLGVATPLPLSYFLMRHMLPALHPQLLDQTLMAIDERFLGVTPSVWMAKFATPATVEWFSFFYYSYFVLLMGNLGTSTLFDKGSRQREITVGAMLIAAIGHTLYTVVPGMGPWATLKLPPIVGGFWWNTVEQAVSLGGAQLDIFPSLHTAYPSFWALHAIRHRREMPFRFLWPILTFFAFNIVIATLFLRWHWAIDVVAGLALAFLAQGIAIIVSRVEENRESPHRQPVWEPWR